LLFRKKAGRLAPPSQTFEHEFAATLSADAIEKAGAFLRNVWGRRKAPGSVKAGELRPAFRRDGSAKATKRRKSFNVTVNAYDPVVHVYTGGAAVVNSADRQAALEVPETIWQVTGGDHHFAANL
jgi:hypothetical protein